MMDVASDAERQRRSRAHRRGDHSLCDPARCEAAADRGASNGPGPRGELAQPEPAVDAGERATGGIETATEAFVATLSFPDGDPRALLGQIAVRLARRVDETGALPAAVRELRVLLGQLAEVPGQAHGPLDELQVRRAQRRLDQILSQSA